MSRRKSSEIQFGSDSFLDVVCNIVAILIILVVIAGVRVSHSPVILPRSPVPIDDVSPEEAGTSPPALAVGSDDETPRLQQQIAAIEQDQADAEEELRRTRSQLATANEQEAALNERAVTVRATISKSESALSTTQQALASTTAELSSLKQIISELAAQLGAAAAAPDAVQRLEHRITPVGRTVNGGELHFRVEHNRVSVVPLERLLGRLKEQIERRKEWLVKARQHEGLVGPVDGYSLRYLVQRDNLSVVDELRYGAGMYRISVAHWEVDLDRDVIHEPIAQALKPGSRFYQALLEAKSESALTFWVYPDSFEAFMQLKAFCHEQNFLVAGRPLPVGVPIAGSPNGSRSSGQ